MSLTELRAAVAAEFFEIDRTAAALQESQSRVEEARAIMLSAGGNTHPKAQQNTEALAEAHQRIGNLCTGLFAARQSFTEYLIGLGVMLPSLTEMANDSSRANIVTRDYSEEEPVPVTEQEVLLQLTEALDTFIEEGPDGDLKADVLSIKDSFNFIGERELNRGCEIIGGDWASYLEANKEAQIVIVPGVSAWQGCAKSDALVLEKILDSIQETHPELIERILGSLSEASASPENVRVIVVDDWTLSRKQMSATLKRFARANKDSPYLGRLETNFVIALPEMITEGFMPLEVTHEPHMLEEDEAYVFENTLSVKSAYVAKPRISSDDPENSPVAMHASGSHSTADFGFEETLDRISDHLGLPRALIANLGWTDEKGDNAFPHFKRLFGFSGYRSDIKKFKKP